MCNTSTGTYERSGTLWEGRFRSCLAQEEDYLMGCPRYIELNSVRAAMVDHPADYRWSSYRVNGQAGAAILSHLIGSNHGLGETAERREAAYRELFRYELDPGLVDEIRRATTGNYALGSERCEQRVSDILGRRVSRGRPGRPKQKRC